MSFLPEIMPADARAPEHMRHTSRKLNHGILGRIVMFLERARERHQLAQLDDSLLRDIGMTRDDARRFTKRSIWDAPTNWTVKGAGSLRADLDRCLTRPGLM